MEGWKGGDKLNEFSATQRRRRDTRIVPPKGGRCAGRVDRTTRPDRQAVRC